MTDFTFPSGNTGSAPTASRTSNLLLDDGTNGGAATVATVLGLTTQADMKGIFAASGSNINYMTFTPATTGNAVALASNSSSDANVDFNITVKGSASISLISTNVVMQGFSYLIGGAQCRANFSQQSSASYYFNSNCDATAGDLVWYGADSNAKMRITQSAQLVVGPSGSPSITTGSGAPSGTQPNGSIYLRSGGSTGTRWYVSTGSAWNAVSGV